MALDQVSATDREIVAVLSEHRVATTQQIATLLEVPERTARYRLDRLWRLGMCGGRQPYTDQGSAPYHWWPSRLADAFHRGRELPRGGEREDPQEQFLRHAAAITGLYVALVRLAPSLGWELLLFAREVEAREEFTLKERQAAIVPDATSRRTRTRTWGGGRTRARMACSGVSDTGGSLGDGLGFAPRPSLSGSVACRPQPGIHTSLPAHGGHAEPHGHRDNGAISLP